MYNRLVKPFIELIVFLGFVFGFLYVLLIVGDGSSTLLHSAKFYFWMELPLVSFGILFGTANIVRKALRR